MFVRSRHMKFYNTPNKHLYTKADVNVLNNCITVSNTFPKDVCI